jgi:hypothetical protein
MLWHPIAMALFAMAVLWHPYGYVKASYNYVAASYGYVAARLWHAMAMLWHFIIAMAMLWLCCNMLWLVRATLLNVMTIMLAMAMLRHVATQDKTSLTLGMTPMFMISNEMADYESTSSRL